MPAKTWYCYSDETYWPSGNQYERRDSDVLQGYNDDEESEGNLRAILLFDHYNIRQTLAGKRITRCLLNVYVNETEGWQAMLLLGTHNHTSLPYSYQSYRVNPRRVSKVVSAGWVENIDLGTTIGNEFRDGVATGIALGPAPNNDDYYWVALQRGGSSGDRRPRLYIEWEDANQAPNVPSLQQPLSGGVVDSLNRPVEFRWAHTDPNADPQTAYRFRRRPLGSTSAGEYWTGAGWTTTVTDRLVSTLTNGTLVIPEGQFAIDSVYEWTVETRDTSNLWSSPAPWRRLYTSRPPTVNITEPGDRARITRPPIRWAFTDVDADAQYGWAAQIVEESIASQAGYRPENLIGQVWSASAEGSATSATPNVDLRNHRRYRAYVQLGSSPNPAGGIQYTGWQYKQFEVVVPPAAPTIIFPANGSTADLADGFTLEWRNNFYSNTGSQIAFKIRRRNSALPNVPYEWWTGTAWVTDETLSRFISGTQPEYTFAPGLVENGPQYVFSVLMVDDYNEESPWSPGAQVLASSAAEVTVTAPTETTNVTNPLVTWTMFDKENDPQQSWRVKIIHSSVYPADPSATFDPTGAVAVWDSGERFEETTRNAEIPVDLENDQDYRAYVQVVTNGVRSGWAVSQFRVSIVPPAPASAEVNVSEGSIDIVIQGRDSMLDLDASRNFDGWQGWDHGGGDTSNSIIDNAEPFGSSQSGYATRVRSTLAGATMAVRTTELWAIAPNTRYTAGVSILADIDTAPLLAYVSIEFYDSAFNLVAVSSDDPESDESAIRSVASGVSPANAIMAAVRVTWRGVPATDTTPALPDVNDGHIIFDPVLRPTTGGEWSPGGTLENTFASVIELSENRLVRYGQNVPIPIETQRVVIRDEEARMGMEMQYAVTIRARYNEQSLVTTPLILDPVRWVDGWVWISDPLRPGSGRYFGPQSFDAVARPVRQGKFRPIGRPDAIMTTGVRGLREGSFTIVTHTRAEREEFQKLSDQSEIILLRIPPDQGELEGETLYVRFEGDAPEERPLAQRTPHRTIKQAWTEQRSPTTGFEYVAPDDVD